MCGDAAGGYAADDAAEYTDPILPEEGQEYEGGGDVGGDEECEEEGCVLVDMPP